VDPSISVQSRLTVPVGRDLSTCIPQAYGGYFTGSSVAASLSPRTTQSLGEQALTSGSPYSEPPEAAALAGDALSPDLSQFAARSSNRPPFAALPVVDKVRPVCVVLENVVIVDGLLD